MMKRGAATRQARIEVLRPLEREPGGGRPNDYEHDHWETGTLIAYDPQQYIVLGQQGTAITGKMLFDYQPSITAENRMRIDERVFEFRGGPSEVREAGRTWVVMVEELGILTQSQRVEPMGP